MLLGVPGKFECRVCGGYGGTHPPLLLSQCANGGVLPPGVHRELCRVEMGSQFDGAVQASLANHVGILFWIRRCGRADLRGLKCWTVHADEEDPSYATFKAQVVLEMLKEEKTVTQIAAEHRIHPGQLHRWKRQVLDNFPHLYRFPSLEAASRCPRPTTYRTLCRNWQAHHTGRVVQKNLAPTLSRAERVALVDAGPNAMPLTTQTALRCLNRSSLYYRPVRPDPAEVGLKYRMDEIHTNRPFCGSCRMTAQLR